MSKFIDGSDLKTRSQDARLSVPESVELTRQVAEALHYAHKKGLVHRDIKPANVLIDTSGKPCVADFGLALKDEEFGKGARIAGTPAYMSPEQAKGTSHHVDGRSDIFSLGVVFYELLTGRKPFRGESYEEVLEQIVTTEARPPRQIDDSIPKELERICLSALSKQVSQRYTTAKDMANDLSQYQMTCGDRQDRPTALAPHECDQSAELLAQAKAAGKLRRIEAKGLLGRTGCMIQISVLCSLFMSASLWMMMDAMMSLRGGGRARHHHVASSIPRADSEVGTRPVPRADSEVGARPVPSDDREVGIRPVEIHTNWLAIITFFLVTAPCIFAVIWLVLRILIWIKQQFSPVETSNGETEL